MRAAAFLAPIAVLSSLGLGVPRPAAQLAVRDGRVVFAGELVYDGR